MQKKKVYKNKTNLGVKSKKAKMKQKEAKILQCNNQMLSVKLIDKTQSIHKSLKQQLILNNFVKVILLLIDVFNILILLKTRVIWNKKQKQF